MIKFQNLSTLVATLVFASSLSGCGGGQSSMEPQKSLAVTVKALCQASFELEDSALKRVSDLKDLPQEKYELVESSYYEQSLKDGVSYQIDVAGPGLDPKLSCNGTAPAGDRLLAIFFLATKGMDLSKDEQGPEDLKVTAEFKNGSNLSLKSGSTPSVSLALR